MISRMRITIAIIVALTFSLSGCATANLGHSTLPTSNEEPQSFNWTGSYWTESHTSNTLPNDFSLKASLDTESTGLPKGTHIYSPNSGTANEIYVQIPGKQGYIVYKKQ